MKIKSIVTGVSFAIAAGSAAFAVANATAREKRMLKSRTGKALHAMGDVMDGISSMMSK